MISETLHGVTSPPMTMFSQTNVLGAAFDRETVGRIDTAIGDEARAIGINQGLALVLDLSLKPG